MPLPAWWMPMCISGIPVLRKKEDIDTGAGAAAAGGVTTVVLMANTRPCVDNRETPGLCSGKGPSYADSCGNLCQCNHGYERGKSRPIWKVLRRQGPWALRMTVSPLLKEETARNAMKTAAVLGVPISFHEENPAFIENNGINRGKASGHFGIGGFRPAGGNQYD